MATGKPLAGVMRMGESRDELEGLRARVKELEARVNCLRLGRRVLMNVLEAVERERRARIASLERTSSCLRRRNKRYAQAIIECHARIRVLENRLAQDGQEVKRDVGD